jgi:hypothetical protein
LKFSETVELTGISLSGNKRFPKYLHAALTEGHGCPEMLSANLFFATAVQPRDTPTGQSLMKRGHASLLPAPVFTFNRRARCKN